MFRLCNHQTESLIGRISSTPGSSLIFSRFKSKSHYEVLGVSQDASKQDIKDAFVKLSKQLHPDINKSDPQTHDKFVRVSEAYSVLSKTASRRQYDNFTNSTYHHSGPTNQNPYQYPNQSHDFHQTFREQQFWAHQRYQHKPPPPPPWFAEEMTRSRASQQKRNKNFLLKLLMIVMVIQFFRSIIFVQTHRNITSNYGHVGQYMNTERSPDDSDLGYVRKEDR